MAQNEYQFATDTPGKYPGLMPWHLPETGIHSRTGMQLAIYAQTAQPEEEPVSQSLLCDEIRSYLQWDCHPQGHYTLDGNSLDESLLRARVLELRLSGSLRFQN